MGRAMFATNCGGSTNPQPCAHGSDELRTRVLLTLSKVMVVVHNSPSPNCIDNFAHKLHNIICINT